jgi:site-specific recombinase XerD
VSKLLLIGENVPSSLCHEEIPESSYLVDPELKEIMGRKIPYHIESLSHNSQAAFKSDMANYMTWCRKNNVCAIPVESIVLRKFVLDMAANQKAPTTIQRYLSTVNKIHQVLGLAKPASEPEVVSAMKNINEFSEHEVRQAQPFREVNLNILGSIIDKDSLKDVRDMAIIACAFSTLLRRSEVARIEVNNLEFDPLEGDGSVEIKKIKSKKGRTDIHYAYLSPIATFWVKKWLEMSEIESGRLFRSLTKHQTVRRRPVDGQVVAMAINRLGRMINKDFNFTGHSTRVGAAIEMVANGIETTKAMNAGRWKDHKTFMRYIARIQAKENGMAELYRKKQGGMAGQ